MIAEEAINDILIFVEERNNKGTYNKYLGGKSEGFTYFSKNVL